MSTTFSFGSTVKLTPKLEGGGFLQAPTVSSAFSLTDGSGTGQADAMWHQVVSVAADTTTTLDLQALAVNALGLSDTLFLASIKTLYIANTATMADVVVFDADEEGDPWNALYTVPVTLKPGGTLIAMDAAGWAVANDAKTIKITNNEEVLTVDGSTANGSAVLTGIEDTSEIIVGMEVAATGIPAGARVVLKSASTVTMSLQATATNEDIGITFQKPAALVVVSLSGVLD
jgi:hypothetical protein